MDKKYLYIALAVVAGIIIYGIIKKSKANKNRNVIENK